MERGSPAMIDAAARPVPQVSCAPKNERALIVSSVFTGGQMAAKLGREAYSYRFVYRVFEPLLRSWGETIEVTQPESRVDYAVWRARQRNLDPVHLSFLPLHMVYLAQGAPTVAVPAFEFPDIPTTNLQNNPRNNWKRIADELSLIITHCHITRKAFLRADVKPPVHVVPVPVAPAYFSIPAWEYGQRVTLPCPCYVFPVPEAGVSTPGPVLPKRASLRSRSRQIYGRHVKPLLPRRLNKLLSLAATAAGAPPKTSQEEETVPYPVTPTLELSGVVYATVFNPFDPRKNWQDMLSAYLLALRDCEDATLVIKLVVCPELAARAINGMIGHYLGMGLRHRCKLVFVNTYLADDLMVDLARGSTYYLNTSRAEGSCLPLQDFLAAGRPGVAPSHTGMADYLDDDVAFTLASHPEPAAWPHDPDQRLTTIWQRLVWQSLYDQLRASYQVARKEWGRYRAMAVCGRERLTDYASSESVWPRLAAALNAVDTAAWRQVRPIV
jgi:glycosyltransferase involved in cell wall biosynthesis